MNPPERRYRTLDEGEADGTLDGLCWEYLAPENACDVGRALSGRRFAKLADLYEHLPGFNENPLCSRRPCACTAMPARIEDKEPVRMKGYLVAGEG